MTTPPSSESGSGNESRMNQTNALIIGLTVLAVIFGFLSEEKRGKESDSIRAVVPGQAASAPSSKPQVDDRAAQKLLEASRKETIQPGIILRYSCQIPTSSKFHAAADTEQGRAERLFDHEIARELRFEAARDLQKTFYEAGKKVNVSVREGKSPALVMNAVFFDNTTAYLYGANGTTRKLAEKFLSLGVHRIVFKGGYDGGSYTEWSVSEVHRAEFGAMESLCEDVRSGKKSPNAINATVSNPS